MLTTITVGTGVGLWALHDPYVPSVPVAQVGVTEVSFNPQQSDLRLRVTLNGKRGFIDGSGQTVIEPVYELAMPFSEGLAAVGNREGDTSAPSWKFVNASGVVVIPKVCVGGQIGTFHEGLAPIVVGNKWGFIATDGAIAIPPKYDRADDFSEGLAMVRVGGKAGLIDRQGKEVLPPTHPFIGQFHNGRAVFAEKDRFGYLDNQGRIAIPAHFDSASDFSEGLAFVGNRENGKLIGGYVDLTGKPAFEPRAFFGGPFREGLAAITPQGGPPCYIDKTGQVVLQVPGAARAGNFSEGLASVELNGLFGFVDRKGEIVIPPQWQFVDEFHRGTCRVNSADVRGYINPQGKYIWKLSL